jgi:hypothetical protein
MEQQLRLALHQVTTLYSAPLHQLVEEAEAAIMTLLHFHKPYPLVEMEDLVAAVRPRQILPLVPAEREIPRLFPHPKETMVAVE